MSPVNDGWTGVRDGGFRGLRLFYCLKHSEPIPWRVQCPACALQRENDALKARLKDLAQATRR